MQGESISAASSSLRLWSRRSVTSGAAIYLLALIAYWILRITLQDGVWWLALVNEFAPLVFVPLPLVLILSLLLRARRWQILAILHSLILVAWWGPRFLPKPPPQATRNQESLQVVSFNVWGDNTRLDEVEAWLRAVQADVVLLQEIPDVYADNQVPELADLYPYQMSQSTSERRYGNLCLSRHPILSVEDLPGAGVPAQQRITIDYEGRVIAVYNVHLAMPIGAPRFSHLPDNFVMEIASRYNPIARNTEIQRLLRRLQTEPHPYLVAGDFNMSEHTAIYTDIAAKMTDAYRVGSGGVGGTWPVAVVEELPSYLPPLLRVDYVWQSEHFLAVRAQRGPEMGSDHLPLYVQLELLGEER